MSKLVRDKIPEMIEAQGGNPTYRVASEEEGEGLLVEKLQEEVAEYVESGNIEELADVLEVVRAIGKQKGVSWEKIEGIREEKFSERGGFETRVVLEEVND